ncbi:MAG: hypothetical protein CMF58_03530 [Lentimicrobiaceae bacterium]|nr:hypothetical protein [Lentimicrobiaceae bacterium]|tara:strand:- start:1280 stop:1897 length:618 start_codon:yes stop_codon:yes gene_type:complete
MNNPFKDVTLLIFTVVILFGFGNKYKLADIIDSDYITTDDGPAINWTEDRKLTQSDFKATQKGYKAHTAAITSSSFGYDISIQNGEVNGHIYVRFYCNSSWWNPKSLESDRSEEILQHEQLHFDICELYGRKMYKEILTLKKLNKLNQKNLNRMYSKLEKEYQKYQNRYDKETDHSLNSKSQKRWNARVQDDIVRSQTYADYYTF